VHKLLDPHFMVSFLRSSVVPNNQIMCSINNVGVGLCNYKRAALWWDLTLKYKKVACSWIHSGLISNLRTRLC